MTQIEYATFDLYNGVPTMGHDARLERLQKLGEEGWELCGMDPGYKWLAIFKRAKDPAADCDLRQVQCCDPVIDASIGRANERIREFTIKEAAANEKIRDLERMVALFQNVIKEAPKCTKCGTRYTCDCGLKMKAETACTVYPAALYQDDMGGVLWWHFPVQEPPEIGMWEVHERKPHWYTHFSRMPIVWDGDGSPLHEVKG